MTAHCPVRGCDCVCRDNDHLELHLQTNHQSGLDRWTDEDQ